VNAPRLNPSQIGRYSIYLPRRDGRLSSILSKLQTWSGRKLFSAVRHYGATANR